MTMTQLAQAIETQGTDMAKIGPKEAALAAQRADLIIPAILDRTQGMSKADFDKLHEKLGKPAPKFKAKIKVATPAKPSTLTDVDKKAIAEIKKAEKAKVEAKKAADAAKRKEEAAEKKAIRDAAKKAKAASTPQKPAGKPKPATAPKAAPKAKLASEPRKGSKTAIIGDLLKRKEGCTTAEILAATGWPAVSVPQQAKAIGVGLRKERKPGEVTRYWAA